MKTTPRSDIYHIYEIEARGFNAGKVDVFWKNVFQSAGVFVFMTFIVFFMINFRFISSQMVDWYSARDYGIAVEYSSDPGVSFQSQKYIVSKNDLDGDGLNDSLESILGTDVNNTDTDNDGYNDFNEISNGHNPLGEGLLKMEIEVLEKETLPVAWRGSLKGNLGKFAIKNDQENLFLKDVFIVPSKYINDQDNGMGINVLVYLGSGKKIRSVYQEKTREISSDFSEIKTPNYGIQIISNWPEGTDWQRLVINTELIKIGLDN